MNITRGNPPFLDLRTRAMPGTGLLGALTVAALLTASLSCTSSSRTSGGDKTIEEIENEKEPLPDTDCLEGEYFDTSTDSCEPMEGQTEHDKSHKGAIDIPRHEVFEEDTAPPPEGRLESELSIEE